MKLSESARQRLAFKSTKNFEAYQTYLEGRFLWNTRSLQGLTNSMDFFERALALDTNYALAWASLADAWNNLADWGYRPPSDCVPRAQECARRALALDPTLAEANAALAKATNIYDWQWSAAEEILKRAIALNPNYASARQWYAELLGCRGRHDEAIVEMSRALQLDPFSPIINRNFGRFLYHARRFKEAMTQLEKTIALAPDFAPAHGMLGDIYSEIGRPQDAVSEWLLHATLSGASPDVIAEFRKAAATSGVNGYWKKHLEEMLEAAKHGYVAPAFIAQNYARLGQTNEALSWLEKACKERSPLLLFINVTPLFDDLHAEPRFKALLKKIGLEE